jgi:signal transduction histidine kinase
MPIRIRLTVWYTFLLGATLIIASTLLYLVLKFSLHAQVDTNLQDRAQQIVGRIKGEAILDLKARALFIPEANDFSSTATYIQIIDREGEVISVSNNLGGERFPVDKEILKENLAGQSRFKTIEIDNIPLRIYSTPLLAGRQVVGTLQVGQPIQGIENTLKQVLVFLSGGTIGALALAFVVGGVLSWAALQPIEKINQTATRIVSGQDLKQRLPPARTNDEIGRLTHTINDMLERLDNFFQAQVHLSADVSHELRTPLTTIRGNVDLLRRGAANDPEELNEALTVMDGELDRMSRIVADLLLLSQADAGLSLRMQSVELDTVMLDVYRQARVIANGVTIQLGHEDQAVIQGDADRLKQLLINLVTNAIKHTPPGGSITLSLHREADWVRITVADTGRGIASTDLPHIFDRFYQANDDGKKGHGLGLSIAQWIAQAHGGEITVTSELGKGSTFTLWLPKKITEDIKTRPLKTNLYPS